MKFLLKKERVFFFRGFCPPSIRTGGVQMQFGLGFAKLFSGDLDFRKTETNFVFEFCPRGGGVWGGIRAGFAFGFFDGKREKD